MHFKKILVIINPLAGNRRISRIRTSVDEYFQQHDVEHVSRLTEAAGDALRWSRAAQAEGFDLVVAVGGDGTTRECAEGLLRSGAKVPLGQVPTGTVNVTARAVSIPTDVRRALDVISSGKIVRFDLGYMPDRDRYFMFVLGAGNDAAFIHDTPRELKKKLGFFAYFASGTKHFFKVRPIKMRLEIDGAVHNIKAHTVMAINVGTIANLGVAVAPNTDPHDGKLNIMVMSTHSLWGSLIVLFKIITKRYYGHSGLTHYMGERIRVTTDPPLPVQIDGDPMDTTPFLAHVIPGGIRMLVPGNYTRPDQA